MQHREKRQKQLLQTKQKTYPHVFTTTQPPHPPPLTVSTPTLLLSHTHTRTLADLQFVEPLRKCILSLPYTTLAFLIFMT